ncbi:uncharacterized protein CANTADRAFT_52464 [Suhomyces tanzawaensis NRRL Y-17324]|uniref:DNA damage checkpoint protein 1 n=1 Tax=Suhomyces tanzawaensis NRRL Y-17324 TaxID=984487 RepID=A0A1E4SFZ5_9ASCO|nr:uncharacterized protein CANTADRAFT_52464 [Suhomyces tanzawaensis NRRL Y-17324]ODV78434.1 hypothetical protein CANTADRAFT_52464 [Suhomyces tanzawaensis NRRL Y-17324]
MSFVAVIDSTKNKQIWSKAIHSLASISDHIKFVVSTEELTLSSVNSARTSHAEIRFKKRFFHEFSVDFTNIINEGYEEHEDGSNSYSFLINSKHLATLFRNLDANDLDYICFRIHWAHDSNSAMKYKLLIEIKTRKLIIKKYLAGYQPLFRKKVIIADIYKDQLQKNDDSIDENRINYIMIEQMVPKQFLDMIPSSTEDFKIEIKNDKILFSGYTKQVLKDREYLKQPMSLTITLNLDELLNSNLMMARDKDPLKKCINFRLKEFKNFMNLISTLNMSNSNNEIGEGYVNLNESEPNGDCFAIYFRNPGDPVLFELQNHSMDIHFIQITTDDTSNMMANSTNLTSKDLKKNSELQLQPYVIHKVEKQESPVRPTKSSSEPKPTIRQPIPKIKRSHTDKLVKRKAKYSTPEPLSQLIPSSAETESMVTYTRESNANTSSSSKRHKTSRSNDDNTDYSDTEEEYMALEDQMGDLEFGPTQLNNKPKSIFDDL